MEMLGSWWLVAAAVVIAFLYLYINWSYNYWKKRGVPYIEPVTFFGNFKEVILGKRALGDLFEEVYWKLDGHPFGGIFRFGTPMLFVRDPELIKTVLVKEFASFHNNDLDISIDVDPLFGRNPFVLHGESWKTTRSQITPGFTAGKIKPMVTLMDEVCQEFVKYIEKKKPTDGFEAKDLCANFTTDVVASCAFGVNGNALHDPNSKFRQIGRDMLQPTFWNNLRILTVLFLPKLAKILRIPFLSQDFAKFFSSMTNEIVEHREKTKTTRNDFLQLLMNLKNKGSIDEQVNDKRGNTSLKRFTSEDLTAQAVTFFTDGFETSSIVMSFALYSLAMNPDVQTKARNEIEEVIRKHGRQLTFEAIQDMTYLEMVISESQRLYPAVFTLTRRCTKPFDIEKPSGGKLRVEVGTPVVIPVYPLQRDPKYYPNPEQFDPERFSEENKKDRHKYVYLPFGEGPRICIGARFGMTQVKAGIATTLLNFEVRPTERTPKRVVPDPQYFLFTAKSGLWLDFVKRNRQ